MPYTSWADGDDSYLAAYRRYQTGFSKLKRQVVAEHSRAVSLERQKLEQAIQSQQCSSPTSELDEFFTIGDEPGMILPDLRQDFREYFTNAKFMRFMTCLLQMLLSSPAHELISRLWLTKVKRIGEKSVYGQVYTGDVGGLAELIVFKVAIENDQQLLEQMVTHEVLMGWKANEYRSFFPNYAYTVMRAACHYDFCQPGQALIVQEYVNGPTADSRIRDFTTVETVNFLLQLLLSSRWAYLRDGFLHCDAHLQNVLLRKLSQPLTISYPNDGNSYWTLTVPWVATFIDFGLSTYRSQLNGRPVRLFAKSGPDYYGSALSPLTDIFRVLWDALFQRLHPLRMKSETAAFRVINRALGFFVSNTHVSNVRELNRLTETYGLLPLTKKPATHDQFLDYLMADDILGPLVKQQLGVQDHPIAPPTFRPNFDTRRETKGPLDFLINEYYNWPQSVTPSQARMYGADLMRMARADPQVRRLVKEVAERKPALRWLA